MGADGSGDRALFAKVPAGCAYAARPAWRGGSFVLPCRDLTTNISTLRVMSLDGTVVRKLDESTLGDPSLSADGSTVYYWRTPVPQDGGELVSAPVDGSRKPAALTEGGKQRDNDPAVSPTEASVAFTRAGVQDGIWLLRPDGTEERLTSKAGDQDPSWSPDAEWIAFKRDNLLWVMRADGSGAKRVTQDSTADTAAAWTSR
jgi:TolB protein